MRKLNIGLAITVAILVAGPAQWALAGSKKSNANQSNHTATSTHSKRVTSTARKSSATRVHTTASGQHIPETSQVARKNRGNDWNCILFPSLCVGPRPKAR